jgi:hypothetical protein
MSSQPLIVEGNQGVEARRGFVQRRWLWTVLVAGIWQKNRQCDMSHCLRTNTLWLAILLVLFRELTDLVDQSLAISALVVDDLDVLFPDLRSSI